VLWLIKGLGNGGAEQLLLSSARLRTRDRVSYRVAYLLPWKSALVPSLAREGVEATCLDSRGSWDVRWLGRLWALLRRERFDVLHVHSPVAAAGARLVVRTLPRQARPAVISTEHNVWSSHHGLTRLANTLTAGSDDVAVAVSSAVRDSIPARLQTRTRVVRYGVEISSVLDAAAGARDSVRAEFGFGHDDIVVGTVANLRRTKGYPDLLAAARRVIDEDTRVRFVAVGQGPLEAELRALHARLHLGARFVFAGYRSDAVRVMSGFDVFCLPSLFEGLPIAMLEALALGLPVVATDVGGIRDFAADGTDIVLVPPSRPDLLAKATLEVACDPARREMMRRTAEARRQQLDVRVAVREMEEIYAQVGMR
jgi:glycosyltransferase involved in cell wall biosynthesis